MGRIVQINRNKLIKVKGNIQSDDTIPFDNLSESQKYTFAELLYSLYKNSEDNEKYNENCS